MKKIKNGNFHHTLVSALSWVLMMAVARGILVSICSLDSLVQSISGHGPSPREGESKEKRETRPRKTCPNKPNPHLLQAQYVLALPFDALAL